MEVSEIEGANFVLAEPDSWESLSAAVSPDKLRLACIYQVLGGFRMQRYIRGTMGPQFQGEWWLEQDAPSMTDKLQHAEHLATEFLHGAA